MHGYPPPPVCARGTVAPSASDDDFAVLRPAAPAAPAAPAPPAVYATPAAAAAVYATPFDAPAAPAPGERTRASSVSRKVQVAAARPVLDFDTSNPFSEA